MTTIKIWEKKTRIKLTKKSQKNRARNGNTVKEKKWKLEYKHQNKIDKSKSQKTLEKSTIAIKLGLSKSTSKQN